MIEERPTLLVTQSNKGRIEEIVELKVQSKVTNIEFNAKFLVTRQLLRATLQ
jgi:hypothetical protein